MLRGEKKKQNKLNIWGKAKRESALRPKSDRGKIQEGGKFPTYQSQVPKLKCVRIHRTRIVDLWQVNNYAYNFFVSGPKITIFC